MATLVYQYGVRNHWDAPQEVVDQLRLAHDLRNALTEIEHRHDDALKVLWSSHPDVAATEHALAEAEDAAQAAVAAARREHSEDRSTVTRAETAREVAVARKAAKAAKAARRGAIAAAYAAAKPAIEQLRSERDTAIKALYPAFGQTSGRGLYWGTHNLILDSHKVAVARVKADRAQGRPAQLRFRRWDGAGTIAAWVMHQQGDPPRTPALLADASASKWRNVLRLPPVAAHDPGAWSAMSRSARRHAGRAHMILTLGGGRTPNLVEVPVQVHRPLPPDADIARWELTRRRVGASYRWTLTITVKVPDPDPAEGAAPVAVHMGWRARPDGSVRVATLASPTPLAVPDSLGDVVVVHDGGRWGEVILPAGWLDVAGRPAALRGRRDLSFAPARDKLADWLDGNPQVWADDERLAPHLVRRWRSPGRLAAVSIRWRDPDVRPDGAADIAGVLEVWRLQDRHLWEWEANERDQVAGRRDDAWRRVAAWITAQSGVIVVDDTNLREVRRREDVADDPVLPGVVAEQARARAGLAAPGRLRQLVAAAAGRRGVAVVAVVSAGLSRLHRDSRCGVESPPDARYAAAAVVTCPACGGRYDQDRNAAMIMLDREGSAGTPAVLEPSRP